MKVKHFCDLNPEANLSSEYFLEKRKSQSDLKKVVMNQKIMFEIFPFLRSLPLCLFC